MKLPLMLLALVVGYSYPASGASYSVDARLFVEQVQGNYEIDSAGGHKPTQDNNQAEVFADTEEGILTMPYCGTSGLCDPGYINLSYVETRAEREDLGAGHFRVDLTTKVGGKSYRYSWEQEPARVTFTNYQYLVGTQVTELKHVLHKVGP
jgi:hypothetical protein